MEVSGCDDTGQNVADATWDINNESEGELYIQQGKLERVKRQQLAKAGATPLNLLRGWLVHANDAKANTFPHGHVEEPISAEEAGVEVQAADLSHPDKAADWPKPMLTAAWK